MQVYLSSCKIDAIPFLDTLQAVLNVPMKFRMNLLQNRSKRKTATAFEIRTKPSGIAMLALPTFSITDLGTPVSGAWLAELSVDQTIPVHCSFRLEVAGVRIDASLSSASRWDLYELLASEIYFGETIPSDCFGRQM